MKILRHLFIASTALLAFGALADVAVVVDPSVPLESVTVEQLERLWLHRPDRYPDGVQLTPVDQESGSPIRKTFVEKVLWKSEVEVAEYWSRRMYSGKGRPPRQFRDDDAVIEEVTANPGAIGYIDETSVDDRVKVVLRIP
jgi:ABC-type phosphate transport system substrate-binding protein